MNLWVSPLDRLTFGAYFPVFQKFQFEQDAITQTTTGTGDVFAFVAYQLTPLTSSLGSSLYLHTKIPTTRPSFEDFDVPLSEGQVDLAIEQQTTWALLPSLWLSGRILFRYRFEVETDIRGSTGRFKPGNETELGLEIAGAPLEHVWTRLTYSGLFGNAWEDRSDENDFNPLQKRQVHNLELGVYFTFGNLLGGGFRNLALDTWFRYPVAGVDFLRGPMFNVGLAYQLDWTERWPPE